jgi:HEPN domain-containing protein
MQKRSCASDRSERSRLPLFSINSISKYSLDITTDQLLDDFAIRSFRDIADGDYISARMACRSRLPHQYLWASQQAIEKYLKCILLLHRIPAKNMRHSLSVGLNAIKISGKLTLDLTELTEHFIAYLDEFARFRYLEVSNIAHGQDLVKLDRAVWELRRFCALDPEFRKPTLSHGKPVPKVTLPGGQLESIIGSSDHPARGPLLWQNAFFGRRARRRVKPHPWMKAINAPLYMNPQILDEVLKYVHLPKDLVGAYRNHKKP